MSHKYLGLFFLFIFLISCSEEGEKKDLSKQKIFHYNQHSNISSLDPAFAKSQNNIWAINHLYNGLVQLNDDLEVIPSIAKRWEISTDGLTYTFNLRSDVRFHDDPCFKDGKGRGVKAEDVVFSFQRIISSSVNSPGSWIFNGRVASQNAFSAPNDSTFVLQLSQPFPPMLSILTMQYCSVVPKEALDKYGSEFRNNPVGTGAFKLKNWMESQALFLEKNPNYFEREGGIQLPYLDGVKISFMNDRKTAFLELIKGKLDLLSGIESSYVNELLDSDGNLLDKHKNSLQFIKNDYLNTEYLGIKMEGDNKNPLMVKKVRQALNFGFDREEMLRSLRNGVGKAANSGITPRGLPSFDDKKVLGYTFNSVEADKLLKEAGYPHGEGIPEVTILANKEYLDLVTYITKEWEEWIGIKVNIELRESSMLREAMSNGKAPFFRASWIADYPDAESFLTMFYSKNPAPPNYTQFKNSKFDQLYEQSLIENEVQKRYQLYQQMEELLVEEAPVIFLFYDESAVFAQKGISGLPRNALNLLSLKRVKK